MAEGQQDNNRNFVINDLSHMTGIYYEKIAEVHLYDQTWNLVTYLNTSFLSHRQILIKNYYEEFTFLCSQHKTLECSRMLKTIKNRIKIIETSYFNLLHLIGKYHRTKRGLINIIGSGSKIIFGTMDQKDSDFIYGAISELEYKQKESITILEDQTTILSNTVNNFNKTMQELKRAETEINEGLSKINNNSINLKQNLEHTLEMVNYFSMLVIDTEIDLNLLVNIVMFTKVGKIHPSVIPAEIFLSKLKESEVNLPMEMFYPVHLKEENINILLEISKISSFVQSDQLIFIIKVPITNQEEYELFNMIPIPQTKLLTTIIVNPKRKYLLISNTKSKAAIFDEIDKDCITIGPQKLCKQITLINPYINSICETDIFLFNKVKQCEMKAINQDLEIWHKLEKHNTWLYVLTKPTIVTITCGILEDITFKGVGTLTLKNKKCRAQMLNTILIPDLELTGEYDNKILGKDLSQDDCCTDDNLKYILAFKAIDPIRISHLNLNELSNTAHRIDVIKGKLTELFLRPNPTYHFSILTYSVGTIIILLMIFYSCKCLRYKNFCLKLCFLNSWFKVNKKECIKPVIIYKSNKSLPKTNNVLEEEYKIDL